MRVPSCNLPARRVRVELRSPSGIGESSKAVRIGLLGEFLPSPLIALGRSLGALLPILGHLPGASFPTVHAPESNHLCRMAWRHQDVSVGLNVEAPPKLFAYVVVLDFYARRELEVVVPTPAPGPYHHERR